MLRDFLGHYRSWGKQTVWKQQQKNNRFEKWEALP